MKTEAPCVWPVSVRSQSGLTLIGLPQQLAPAGEDGRGQATGSGLPLEAMAGVDWTCRLLACLLPASLSWAWWTTSGVRGMKQIRARSLPDRLVHPFDAHVCVRRKFWQRRSLWFLPARQPALRQLALEWAGIDTEQAPEFLMTIPEEAQSWDAATVLAWCQRPEDWLQPSGICDLPIERLIVLFDGAVHCALPPAQFAAAWRQVRQLAAEWDVQMLPGAPEQAWPVMG